MKTNTHFKKNKFTLLLLSMTLIITSIHAEMKCESGKCSASKEVNKKVIPAKPEVKKTTVKTQMSAEEHKKMLEEEAQTNKYVNPSSKKLQERNNKSVIEQLFNVRTVTVKVNTIAKKQTNYGYIKAIDARKIDVVSWYSGFVEVLYADTLYKKVKKGDPLVKIYSPEVYKAKQDYLNSIKFNAQRSSPGMLRGAKAKLKLLNVSKQEIEAIRKTRTVQEYTTIYAPISGWLFMKSLNEGSAIKKQEKLFEIVNLDEVWMEAKIFQKELKNLSNIEEYSLTVAQTEKIFSAQKVQLIPIINTKEATATLRLLVKNEENILLPGMYAKLHSMSTQKEQLIIPRTAALRKDGKWYAFLATEFKGEYEPIEIKIEPLDQTYFIVKKGLHKDENIVNNALFMMDSDAQINSIY